MNREIIIETLEKLDDLFSCLRKAGYPMSDDITISQLKEYLLKQLGKNVYDDAKKTLQQKSILSASIEILELPVRAENCLRQARVKTLGDLIKISRQELLSYKNFGKESLKEIEIKISEFGLLLHDYETA